MPLFRRLLSRITSSARGIQVPRYSREFRQADQTQDAAALLCQNLRRMLEHCSGHVPYYQALLRDFPSNHFETPEKKLCKLPILTKSLIRENFDALKSNDLALRQWRYNTSGGSTGEPIRFIQDTEYAERSAALTDVYSAWLGCEVGESQLLLWGSERDLFYGKPPLKTRLGNWLRNSQTLNAFQMTVERMRDYLAIINRVRPRLIIAYAQAIYELAKFAEAENIAVVPQHAILTSAGTLYQFMREKIEQIFGCRVFNRYGSREVGLIACERPGYSGLVASPQSNYIEIVDCLGSPVPFGVEGDILVTNLFNKAMPLVRYAIGDRGMLADPAISGGNGRQILTKVSGRNVDAFRTAEGGLIDGEYFTHLLYFRPWLSKFQVIQKTPLHLMYKIVLNATPAPADDLEEIRQKSRLVLGNECQVDFEYLAAIPPSSSGKYRYTISEVDANSNGPISN
jgi:phenylacetate-CoA ligase